jgi:4'-phosphopantetheinyl transferase
MLWSKMTVLCIDTDPLQWRGKIKISPNEIHIWYAQDQLIDDPALLYHYRACLSDDERRIQQRFFFSKDRHQYLITRVMVRNVLSLYSDSVAPHEWVFEKNNYGKPFVKNFLNCPPLNFNVSHTEKMTIFAVTLVGDIGVDIELLKRGLFNIDLAKSVFTDREFSKFGSLLEEELKEAYFFDVWTLKEAYIKARGMGLTIPLRHISFSFPNENAVEIAFDKELNDRSENWKIYCLKVNETHKISLAVKTSTSTKAFRISVREIMPFKKINFAAFSIARQSF